MKSFKFILSVLLIAFSLPTLFGQANLLEDYEISQMMDKFMFDNKATQRVSGWRIQILATTDRRKMEEEQRKFMAKYPEIAVDWIHAKPYYKLKAGAFATKSQALPVLHRIKADFPGAFPTKDNSISPRELVGL